MTTRKSLVKLLTLGLAVAGAALGSHAGEKNGTHAPATFIIHVAPPAAQKLVAEKKVVVLDLRTPEEFRAGHIAGATNVDYLAPGFEQRLNTLPKTQPYLVHCAAGGRSTKCLPLLREQHFRSIYHLDGGLKAWEKAGLPVEK